MSTETQTAVEPKQVPAHPYFYGLVKVVLNHKTIKGDVTTDVFYEVFHIRQNTSPTGAKWLEASKEPVCLEGDEPQDVIDNLEAMLSDIKSGKIYEHKKGVLTLIPKEKKK